MSDNEANIREKQIYESYQNVIAPLIVELEARDLEYPVELLNEIRSIFTHLSRFKLNNSENDLSSAEKHIKRAILDCFKYICVSCATEMKDFRKQYREVDLSLANNGNFLSELNKLDNEARKTYISAKNLEITMNASEDDLYDAFQKAYNSYTQLIQFIEDSQESILFASNHSKRKNIVALIGFVATIISAVIAFVK